MKIPLKKINGSINYKYLYKTNRWKSLSSNFLRRHPKCVFCGEASQVTDHIIPHHGDELLFYRISNLQPLCKTCHDSVKAKMENGKIAGKDFIINNQSDDDGLPLAKDHPWNK